MTAKELGENQPTFTTLKTINYGEQVLALTHKRLHKLKITSNKIEKACKSYINNDSKDMW